MYQQAGTRRDFWPKIGQYVVVARRKGGTWYVGAMTNETGRKITVPLSFLTKDNRNWQARVWQDGDTMNSLQTLSTRIGGRRPLPLNLAPSGGAVAILNSE